MIANFQQIGLASLAAFVLGFGASGFLLGPHFEKKGYEKGAVAGQDKYDALYDTAARITGERQQCYGEVEKVNAEIARQREENRKLLMRDKSATQVAITRTEQAAQNAARRATETQIRIEESRDALKKLADSCVAAGVPSEFVGVLNGIIAQNGAIAANDGRGDLPGK